MRVGDGPSKHHADVQNEMNFFPPFSSSSFSSILSLSLSVSRLDIERFISISPCNIRPSSRQATIVTLGTRRRLYSHGEIKVKKTLKSIDRHISTALKWTVKYADWMADCCWPIVFQYQQLRNQTKEKNEICCAIYSFSRCRQEVQLSSF